MPSAPIPESEQLRLAALYRYQILDTHPEAAYDQIARLAARLTQAPIVLISFVDANRQWFKARIGLDQQETERCVAFCGYAILGDDLMEVCDATTDPRFHDNALVTRAPDIRYYAGAPIVTREGLNLGSLCVMDTVPRSPLPMEDRQVLRDLAALIVDQLELRVAFKERADFFANLTHEIRGPLCAALGYVDLLHSKTLGIVSPAPYGDYLQNIRTACNQVVDLISELLDFFKCEAGYLVLNETEFEVAALLEECAAMVKALVVSHGLTLRVTVDRSDRRFVADRPRIRQILLNLLINAIKFTPRGGRISVRTHFDCDRGLILSVSDTGIGMGPTDIAKALTPFGQINTGIAAEIAGAGLGLPFAMRLAELHGGRLDIESKLNLGSKVIVRLPARQLAATRNQEQPSRKSG